MNTVLRFILSIFILTTSISSFAQEKPIYAMINYIKVDRGQSAAYLDLIKNFGTRMYSERIKKGEIVSWSVFSVPTSSEPNEYNFVSVTQANSIQALMESANTKEIGKTAMPNTPDVVFDEIGKKYSEIRVILHSNICKMLDRLPSNGDSKYYNIAYMKVAPTKTTEYVKLESEIYKPLHKERMTAGEITGWALWDNTVITPGENSDYNFVTANAFNDFDKYANVNYAGVFKKIFPTLDLNKLTAQTLTARTLVKSEIWKNELRLNQTNVK